MKTTTTKRTPPAAKAHPPTAKSPMPAKLRTKGTASPARRTPTPATPTKKRHATPPVLTAPAAPESKKARLIRLLQSSEGATMDQMTALTGWLPHTVRATISVALRRKLGLTVQHTASTTGERRYSIAAA
jgi:hypothetical protein